MKIDKAIEILTELRYDPYPGITIDTRDALNLAINCMGYVHTLKRFPYLIDSILLPEVTNEQTPNNKPKLP